MSDIEREVLEVDVLFVGAGPACLAGAIHLVNCIKLHDEAIEAGKAGDKIGMGLFPRRRRGFAVPHGNKLECGRVELEVELDS